MAQRPNRRGRRTDQQMFLDHIARNSNNGESLVTNNTLMQSLGWEKSKYDRIKQQLLNDEQIIVGRGQGGKVGLQNIPDNEKIKIFISYCHRDETFKDELLAHLTPLKQLNLVDTWSDREILAGEEWNGEINNHLDAADIIIFIVSIDFINSSYCFDIEMERALERNDEKTACVIPVIARSCYWQHALFSKLQALPKDAKPIATWEHREAAYVDIVVGIKKVAESILSTR